MQKFLRKILGCTASTTPPPVVNPIRPEDVEAAALPRQDLVDETEDLQIDLILQLKRSARANAMARNAIAEDALSNLQAFRMGKRGNAQTAF